MTRRHDDIVDMHIGQHVTCISGTLKYYGRRGTIIAVDEHSKHVFVQWLENKTWILPSSLIDSANITDEQIAENKIALHKQWGDSMNKYI